MGTRLPHRFILIVTLVSGLLFKAEILEDAEKHTMQFVIWNVGQGDFMTLLKPNACWLFDVGGSRPPTPFMKQWLSHYCRKKSTTIYLSHFDRDHVLNIYWVLKILKVKSVWLSHREPKTQTGKKLLDTLRKNRISVQQGYSGHPRPCVWPRRGQMPVRENDKSMAFCLKFKRRTLTLAGDLSSAIEEQAFTGGTDILKVAHHGSQNSTSWKSLKSWKPKVCVISAGTNHYGHPHKKTLSRLKQNHCAILRTDRVGHIFFQL